MEVQAGLHRARRDIIALLIQERRYLSTVHDLSDAQITPLSTGKGGTGTLKSADDGCSLFDTMPAVDEPNNWRALGPDVARWDLTFLLGVRQHFLRRLRAIALEDTPLLPQDLPQLDTLKFDVQRLNAELVRRHKVAMQGGNVPRAGQIVSLDSDGPVMNASPASPPVRHVHFDNQVELPVQASSSVQGPATSSIQQLVSSYRKASEEFDRRVEAALLASATAAPPPTPAVPSRSSANEWPMTPTCHTLYPHRDNMDVLLEKVNKKALYGATSNLEGSGTRVHEESPAVAPYSGVQEQHAAPSTPDPAATPLGPDHPNAHPAMPATVGSKGVLADRVRSLLQSIGCADVLDISLGLPIAQHGTAPSVPIVTAVVHECTPETEPGMKHSMPKSEGTVSQPHQFDLGDDTDDVVEIDYRASHCETQLSPSQPHVASGYISVHSSADEGEVRTGSGPRDRLTDVLSAVIDRSDESSISWALSDDTPVLSPSQTRTFSEPSPGDGTQPGEGIIQHVHSLRPSDSLHQPKAETDSDDAGLVGIYTPTKAAVSMLAPDNSTPSKLSSSLLSALSPVQPHAQATARSIHLAGDECMTYMDEGDVEIDGDGGHGQGEAEGPGKRPPRHTVHVATPSSLSMHAVAGLHVSPESARHSCTLETSQDSGRAGISADKAIVAALLESPAAFIGAGGPSAVGALPTIAAPVEDSFGHTRAADTSSVSSNSGNNVIEQHVALSRQTGRGRKPRLARRLFADADADVAETGTESPRDSHTAAVSLPYDLKPVRPPSPLLARARMAQRTLSPARHFTGPVHFGQLPLGAAVHAVPEEPGHDTDLGGFSAFVPAEGAAGEGDPTADLANILSPRAGYLSDNRLPPIAGRHTIDPSAVSQLSLALTDAARLLPSRIPGVRASPGKVSPRKHAKSLLPVLHMQPAAGWAKPSTLVSPPLLPTSAQRHGMDRTPGSDPRAPSTSSRSPGMGRYGYGNAASPTAFHPLGHVDAHSPPTACASSPGLSQASPRPPRPLCSPERAAVHAAALAEAAAVKSKVHKRAQRQRHKMEGMGDTFMDYGIAAESTPPTDPDEAGAGYSPEAYGNAIAAQVSPKSRGRGIAGKDDTAGTRLGRRGLTLIF